MVVKSACVEPDGFYTEAMAFPIPAHHVLNALVTLCKNEGQIPDLLKACTARIEVDATDNGYANDNTIFYLLLIEMPPEMYAELGGHIEEMEKQLKEKVRLISKGTQGHWISDVSFVLKMNQDVSPAPADPKAVSRIWSPGMFRLFISHRSEEKDAATSIKQSLAIYGVSAFVAHEDVDVSEVWENEILNALRSMQALLVMVTPRLHESIWCNQEIGFAIGTNVPIVPLCIDGNLPKGFVARIQGKHVSSEHLPGTTDHILETLSKNDRTKSLMRECLIEALIHSRSYVSTSMVFSRIATLPNLTKAEAERMKTAFTNDQVSTYGASHKIKALIQQHYPRWGKPKPADDEIPF